MLARAQTSTALTWAGRLGVLGLAALLSPSAPAWAQDKPSESYSQELLPERVDGAIPPGDHPVHRDAAEKLEQHLKSLAERLGKDVGPVGEEIRKAIEAAAGTVNETLKKDDLTTDDLRKALERAGEELRRSFQAGGPIDQEARDAWEKAQDEFRATLDRAREDARNALRYRYDLESDRLEGEEGDADKADEPASAELSKARDQVRKMQQELRAAIRNLEQLERRESRSDRAPRRRPEPRVRPRPPAPPSPPAESARPDEPPARRFFRGPGPGAPDPRADRRINDLESKMDRLLEELKDLKRDKDKGKKDKEEGKDKDDEDKDEKDDDEASL